MASNYCGDCKHWHEHEVQEFPSCRSGDCDKIQKGTKYQDGKEYEHDGWSFEDECYDECLHSGGIGMKANYFRSASRNRTPQIAF